MIKNKNKYKTLYSFDISDKKEKLNRTNFFLNKLKDLFYFNRNTDKFEFKNKEWFEHLWKKNRFKDLFILNFKWRIRRLKDNNINKYNKQFKDIQEIENVISKIYHLLDQIIISFNWIDSKKFILFHIHMIENLKELNNNNSFKNESILYFSLYLMYIMNVVNDKKMKYNEIFSILHEWESYKTNAKNYLLFTIFDCINEIKNLNIKIQEDSFTNQVYLFISSKENWIDSLWFHIILNDYLFFKDKILLKLKEVIEHNNFNWYNKNIILWISSYYLNWFYRT